MKSVLLCGLAKFRRKKVPNFFLGVCIIMMSALFVNALVLLKELNVVFDRAYEAMEGAQLCCLWSREMFSPEMVKQYLDDLPEDFRYQITENTKTVDYIEKDGKKLSNGILLELPQALEDNMISPKVLEQSELNQPQKDEIWITTKIANILGLRTGDELSLQLAESLVKVKVAKIVVDPVFGSSSTNIYRMWCGYGCLSDYPLAENNAMSYLEIRFKEYSSAAEHNFIRETEAYFDMPLGNALYTYDKIKSGYMAVYKMAGAVFCFVSVILAVTIIVLTLFLVKSDIDEDVRNIGLYKSLGMTSMQIIGIYLVCYGLTGFAGAVLGSAAGGFLSVKIITGILGMIGIYTVSFTGVAGYHFLVCIAVLAAVLLICLFTVLKVRRLNASLAVRTGAWQADKDNMPVKKPKSVCYDGKASFEFYYAVRGMHNKKVRYGYIAGVSMILSCLAVVCTGCLNAVKNIDREPEMWGFIRTDIYVTSTENVPVSAIINELEKNPKVDYTYGVNKIYVPYKPHGKNEYQSIVAELYELPWNERIKDKSLYGRRPVRENEISVGVGLAKDYGLEIGEKMELFINGEKREYEITGIFQTLSNSGKVLRMVTDNLDKFVEPDGKYGDYMLVLHNGGEKWEYAKELAECYHGAYTFIASKSNGENITGVLVPAAWAVLTVLFTVIALVTTNLTFLLIRREQGQIGLLKAVGMTSRQVLKIYLFRNGLAAFAGSITGLAAGVLVMPGVLAPYVRVLGLTKFPFENTVAGMLLGFMLSPVCMLSGTCAVMKTIRRISIKHKA